MKNSTIINVVLIPNLHRSLRNRPPKYVALKGETSPDGGGDLHYVNSINSYSIAQRLHGARDARLVLNDGALFGLRSLSVNYLN
jgi:hypothetical protein